LPEQLRSFKDALSLADTPEKRVAAVRQFFAPKEPQVEIRTVKEAIAWGEAWMLRARRLEWDNESLRTEVKFERDSAWCYLKLAQTLLAKSAEEI
jgi:hypothetical protein